METMSWPKRSLSTKSLALSAVSCLSFYADSSHAVPLHQLGLIVLAAAVAAVLAAALPARRAARLDVLKAISNE
jgi:putative ABC transport system permease protein